MFALYDHLMTANAARRVLLVLPNAFRDPTGLTAEFARRRLAAVEADSIPEAQRHLHGGEGVDAVVLAVGTPPGQSWNLVTGIRKNVDLARLPVVVVGQRFSDRDALRAEELDCSYLSFPVEPDEIAARVERLIRRGLRTRLRAVAVVLLTDVCEIRGTLHLPADLARFSDAWEVVVGDERTFVPVTRARITTLDTQRVIGTPEFVEVPKTQLRAIFPVEPAAANGQGSVASPAALARLEKLTLQLAKELARERNLPVEATLADVARDLALDEEADETPSV